MQTRKTVQRKLSYTPGISIKSGLGQDRGGLARVSAMNRVIKNNSALGVRKKIQLMERMILALTESRTATQNKIVSMDGAYDFTHARSNEKIFEQAIKNLIRKGKISFTKGGRGLQRIK